MLANSSLTTCSRADVGACFNYPFLTQKERDSETGLDYFVARYYASVQGRFTGVDPLNIALEVQEEAKNDAKKAYQKLQVYLSLPQQWNRYSYALNNPSLYIDPSGEAILLSDDKDERERQMQALKGAVGKDAAGYLYAHQGDDGKWYVGILGENPDNGDKRGFGKANEVAGVFDAIVRHSQVVKLEMVNAGWVTDDSNGRAFIASAGRHWLDPDTPYTPGATGYFNGMLTSKMLDWGRKNIFGNNYDLGYLPGNLMSNGSDNMMTPSVMVAHELAHAWYVMQGGKDPEASKKYAVDFENKVRMLQDRNGPTRRRH